jgi:hypothetical protein
MRGSSEELWPEGRTPWIPRLSVPSRGANRQSRDGRRFARNVASCERRLRALNARNVQLALESHRDKRRVGHEIGDEDSAAEPEPLLDGVVGPVSLGTCSGTSGSTRFARRISESSQSRQQAFTGITAGTLRGLSGCRPPATGARQAEASSQAPSRDRSDRSGWLLATLPTATISSSIVGAHAKDVLKSGGSPVAKHVGSSGVATSAGI